MKILLSSLFIAGLALGGCSTAGTTAGDSEATQTTQVGSFAERARTIEKGMTIAQVRQIMGDPQNINTHSTGTVDWSYSNENRAAELGTQVAKKLASRVVPVVGSSIVPTVQTGANQSLLVIFRGGIVDATSSTNI